MGGRSRGSEGGRDFFFDKLKKKSKVDFFFFFFFFGGGGGGGVVDVRKQMLQMAPVLIKENICAKLF